jgi:magnesium chelatase family protein
MNPCPCGYLGSSLKSCRCTPDQVARYQGKLSGPLLDRIDLHIEVPAVPATQLLDTPAGEASSQVRVRVVEARERAIRRQGKANQALQGAEIDRHAQLDAAALQFLHAAASRLGWSGAGPIARSSWPERSRTWPAPARCRRGMWRRRCSTGVRCTWTPELSA